MKREQIRLWTGRLVVAVLLVVGACAQHRPDDPFASLGSSDPFDDPFFDSSFDDDSSDPSSAVDASDTDWLYGSEDGAHAALSEHADPYWDTNRSDELDLGRNKTFAEKAQEASLATLSILVGVGMTALPFLLGT